MTNPYGEKHCFFSPIWHSWGWLAVLALKSFHGPGGWFLSQAGENSVCLFHEDGNGWEFFCYSLGLSAKSKTQFIGFSARMKGKGTNYLQEEGRAISNPLRSCFRTSLEAQDLWSFGLVRIEQIFPWKTLKPLHIPISMQRRTRPLVDRQGKGK